LENASRSAPSSIGLPVIPSVGRRVRRLLTIMTSQFEVCRTRAFFSRSLLPPRAGSGEGWGGVLPSQVGSSAEEPPTVPPLTARGDPPERTPAADEEMAFSFLMSQPSDHLSWKGTRDLPDIVSRRCRERTVLFGVRATPMSGRSLVPRDDRGKWTTVLVRQPGDGKLQAEKLQGSSS
jgi:hypothetical protein